MKSFYAALVALASFLMGTQQGSEMPSDPPIWTLETITTAQPSTTAPEPSRTVRRRVTTTTSTTTSTTTTTTTTIPNITEARYPEYWQTAIDAGWPTEWLPTLDLIIHKESRGIPGLTGGGAVGITQIQWDVWHKTVTELGYTKQQIRDEIKPNLHVALVIAETAENAYEKWCQPWYMSINYREYC